MSCVRCQQEGRALVIAANKSDLLPAGLSRGEYEEGVRRHCEKYLTDFGSVQVVTCVASSSEGINRYAVKGEGRNTSGWHL